MVKPFRVLSLILLLALVVIPGLLTVHPVEAQTLGTNWIASFFNNTTASGTPVATNVSFPNGISKNWSTGAPTDGNNNPISGVASDNFSATFTSVQNFTQTGSYLFTVRYNDGVRVYINGALVLDQFTQLASPDASGACQSLCHEVQFVQTINAGNVQMRVDFVEFTGDAVLQFQWGLSGGSGGTATGPTATPVPAATGTVIRVKGLAIRTGPYLGASLVGVARPGTSYPILERNKDEGLFVWYKITAGDNSGWVSGRYFEVAGNIEAIPFTGSVFDTIDNAPDLGVVGVTRAIMNLRRRPSERATLLDKVPWGAEVPVVGRTIQGGKNFWLQVRYNGKVGWIFAPYVGVRGIVDAVPVR